MDVNLAEAAKTGNIDKLRTLLAGNPFLMKPAELSNGDNPLHIACLNNRAEFVKKILCYRLEFAKELNRDGLSPLHIASAYGHIETVKELLKVGPHLCLVKGKDGRIPLHYAVMEGQIDVIDELLSANLGSIKKLTVAKETCFHIAIKYGQVEALGQIKKLTVAKETCFHIAIKYGQVEALGHLMSQVILLWRLNIKMIVNMKDDQGNSVLHLTASMKEYGVWLQQLKSFLNINSRNNRTGLTPLDILVSEEAHIETQEMLRLAGAKEEKKIRYTFMRLWFATIYFFAPKPNDVFYLHDISSEYRNSLLVVLVLIVTATYQSMFNPPGGVWQGPGTDNNATNVVFARKPGHSVMAIEHPHLFSIFLCFNSLGFFSSVCMLPMLTGRSWPLIPINVSLLALFITYFSCILFFFI